ncbi:MAG: cytochrome C [Gemmatimonadetes bacterium]|jgi:nitrate reductase (cytochrome), electron transfer subunit|nr:cytochrome C [Gemmatimonadota bacterium]MBT6145926.1 cytochrome C [Gemmatimonadota bacterium]MBT7863205.1 cytochrome C [Gemmatimonadota bacterium]
MSAPSRYRVVRILGAVVVLALVVWVVGENLRSDDQGPSIRRQLAVARSGGDYHSRAGLAPDLQPATGTKARTLNAYYDLRAYAGAPPVIPHEVDAEMLKTQSCNICHERGGFVRRYNAYAPVTPHPTYGNCLQCHALPGTADLLTPSDWVSIRRPAIGRPALPGNPPPIPHTLQLREECLSCHAGPAAVAEVRTSHPERLNCRQCHVPRTVNDVYVRMAQR